MIATVAFPAQPNLSLIDGLAVLQALASSPQAVGTRELARLLNLEVTRVNRLLKTLAGIGLAEQDENRRFRPGPAIHVLATQSLFGSGLIRRALPVLESLHVHGLTVALGVLWNDQVCYLYHGTPGMKSAEALGRVAIQPATQTAVGTILLAQWSDDDLRSMFDVQPVPHFRTLGRLMKTIRTVRKIGHLYLEFEPAPLRATLAVTLGVKPYAAIALSGAITPASADNLLPALLAAATLIDPSTQALKNS
jgi:DNA-binding IclR family transcriptional regulator